MALRPSEIVGTALVPAAVLAYDPAGWFSFVPAKWLVITTLGLVTIGAVNRDRPMPTVSARIKVIGVALLAWLTVVTSLGLEGRYAWLGTPERHSGLLLWVLCAAMFIYPPSIAALAHGSVLAALGLTVALGQHSGSRLTGTYGSAAYLGAACTLLLPLVIAVTFGSERIGWRIAARIGALGLIASLVGSGTRGAWLAMIVVTVAAVVCGWRPPWRWVAVAATVAVVAFTLSGSANRLSTAFDNASAGGASRFDEWRVGLNTLAEHPLVGVGPEGYRLAFREGVDAAYEREHGRDVQPDRAHNSLLDIALVAGLPGLGLYLALLAAVGLAIVVRVKDANSPILTYAAMSLAAYHLQQLFLFPLAELEPIAWALAGAILIAPALTNQPIAGLSVWRHLATVSCGILAVIAGWAGGRDIQADRAAWQALQAYDRGDASAARTHLAEALRARPDQVRLQMLAVNLSPDPAVVDTALAKAVALSPQDPIVIRRVCDQLLRSEMDATERVIQIAKFVSDDRHNAYLQQRLGTAAAIAGQFDVAERSWLIAEDLAPSNPSPPAFLASLYEQQGRKDEAKFQATIALDLHPADPELVRGLQAILSKVDS